MVVELCIDETCVCHLFSSDLQEKKLWNVGGFRTCVWNSLGLSIKGAYGRVCRHGALWDFPSLYIYWVWVFRYSPREWEQTTLEASHTVQVSGKPRNTLLESCAIYHSLCALNRCTCDSYQGRTHLPFSSKFATDSGNAHVLYMCSWLFSIVKAQNSMATFWTWNDFSSKRKTLPVRLISDRTRHSMRIFARCSIFQPKENFTVKLQFDIYFRMKHGFNRCSKWNGRVITCWSTVVMFVSIDGNYHASHSTERCNLCTTV